MMVGEVGTRHISCSSEMTSLSSCLKVLVLIHDTFQIKNQFRNSLPITASSRVGRNFTLLRERNNESGKMAEHTRDIQS